MEQIVGKMNKIINDTTYNEIIKSLAKQKGFEISDGGFHMKTIYENEFKKSNFSEDELIDILKKRKEQLIRFVLLEDSSSTDEDCLIGEYQEGEEQDDDISNEEETGNEIPKYFLISSLIKFNFLQKNDQKGLEEYFKKMRIPYAKQYAKELKGIYNSLGNVSEHRA
jgi:hypothetical protein